MKRFLPSIGKPFDSQIRCLLLISETLDGIMVCKYARIMNVIVRRRPFSSLEKGALHSYSHDQKAWDSNGL